MGLKFGKSRSELINVARANNWILLEWPRCIGVIGDTAKVEISEESRALRNKWWDLAMNVATAWSLPLMSHSYGGVLTLTSTVMGMYYILCGAWRFDKYSLLSLDVVGQLILQGFKLKEGFSFDLPGMNQVDPPPKPFAVKKIFAYKEGLLYYIAAKDGYFRDTMAAKEWPRKIWRKGMEIEISCPEAGDYFEIDIDEDAVDLGAGDND